MRKAMPGRKIDEQFCVVRSGAEIACPQRNRTCRQGQRETLRSCVAYCLRLAQALVGHPNCLIQKSLVPQHTCQHNARLDLPVMLEANDIVETNGSLPEIASRVDGEHLLQMAPCTNKVAQIILGRAEHAFAN